MNFVQTAEFENLIGCNGNPATEKLNFAKKYLKNHLLRSHKGREAET